jgi:hypothetical protein
MKMTILLVSIFISFSSFNAFAQTQVLQPESTQPPPPSTVLSAPNSEPSLIKVKWYKPVFQNGAPEGKVRTILSGQTEAASQIDIAATEVSVIQANGEIQDFKASDLKSNSDPIQADGNGYFEMSLDLPQGGVQLPIGVVSADKANTYQLNLAVSPKSVEMKSPEKLQTSPALEHSASIWAGIGYTYVNMKQDIDSIQSHVSFENFRGPSLFFETQIPLSDHWDLIGSYQKSPGSVESPEGFNVQSGNYSWNILTLDGRYSKSTWKKMFFQKPAKFYLRFGVNQNTVPFWERTSTTTADIKTNQVLMASLGGQVDYESSAKWVLTSFLRFHHPISSDSDEKVSSQVSFDGSIGTYYKFDNRWNLGGFWYGRYHGWNFSHTDPILNQEVSGHQEFLFSNMEIRIGYGF